MSETSTVRRDAGASHHRPHLYVPPDPPAGGRPLPPELALIEACGRYAEVVAGASLVGITLAYADGRTARLTMPPGFRPGPSWPSAAIEQPSADPGPAGPRLVGKDGAKIVAAIRDAGTPLEAKAVVARVPDVERSKVYVLLGDLKDRGVLTDDGGGYELAE